MKREDWIYSKQDGGKIPRAYEAKKYESGGHSGTAGRSRQEEVETSTTNIIWIQGESSPWRSPAGQFLMTWSVKWGGSWRPTEWVRVKQGKEEASQVVARAQVTTTRNGWREMQNCLRKKHTRPKGEEREQINKAHQDDCKQQRGKYPRGMDQHGMWEKRNGRSGWTTRHADRRWWRLTCNNNNLWQQQRQRPSVSSAIHRSGSVWLQECVGGTFLRNDTRSVMVNY
jgi:hypothetical protein